MKKMPRMEYEDQVRADSMSVTLARLSADADASHFVRYLTEKQRLYAINFVRFKGNWKQAARAAGYSAKTSQRNIEEGEAMCAYMTSVKAEMARRLTISADRVLSRLDRIAVKAELVGDLGTAVRANKLLADSLGLLKQEAPTIRVNADGVQITIGSTRAQEDDVLDAEYREILEVNGMAVPELPLGVNVGRS